MRVYHYGNESNPPLILIHGFQCPLGIWQWHVTRYKKDFHVIVPELPGHNPECYESFSSFQNCAIHIEEFCKTCNATKSVSIYAISMGGLVASLLWQRGILEIDRIIMESSPLLPMGKIWSRFSTKFYINIGKKTRNGDAKTLENAKKLIHPNNLDSFITIVKNLKDSDIDAFITEISNFKLPDNLKAPDQLLCYIYGGSISEMFFYIVSKYIKRKYPTAKTIRLKGMGHCEELLLRPEDNIKRIDKLLLLKSNS